MNIAITGRFIKEGYRMPTLKEHKNKYDINKNLLDNELKIGDCTCYDWITVVAFYSAMHLIEGELAKSNIHNGDHTCRKRTVERFSNFRSIRNQYKVLYDRSRVARYGPAVIDKAKAENALECLKEIEKEITLN